eukprot:NODE_8868_length_535_cov_102.428922_g8845_i0.p2 GENE.NODE_8868_length_535_cov_102.428922_g8845_i0~~NODE_8868_length_535_cov_102.428922_g8845_i0.p2  ORF type:complete len:144 (+),score=31.88 NODE_8868_length_535_cov_102.428922_g8845_i0:72-503(+)
MSKPNFPAGLSGNEKIALLAKRAEQVRIGGPGTMRRKHKAAHRSTGDDTKLQHSLKRMGLTAIGDIEEVNLMMDNGNVIHFENPKVQASIPSNTYVVSGPNTTKSVADMFPALASQLGGAAPAPAAEAEDADIPDEGDFDSVE